MDWRGAGGWQRTHCESPDFLEGQHQPQLPRLSIYWPRIEHPGRLRFSLAHLTVLGCAPPEMTYIAARAGYDFVSYRLVTMHLPDEPNYDLGRNNVMLRQTRTAFAQTGLKVNDLELARIQDGVNINSYVPALETAAELGARGPPASGLQM